jgi:kremen protein
MTERGDPKAVFAPTYACNPDETTETQVELRFIGREGEPDGGWICVRPSFDGSHEFRYYPPGNDRKSEDSMASKHDC